MSNVLKIHTCRFIAIVLLAIAFACSSQPAVTETQQLPQLVSSLSRDSMLIGEQAVWTFQATVDKPADIYFAQIDSLGNGMIEVLKTVTDTLTNDEQQMSVSHKLWLTSFEAASYTLPSIPLLVVRNRQVDTLYFEPAGLHVATVAIDTTFRLHDIKPPIQYPYTFREFLPYILIALGTLLLITLIIYIVLRVTKKNILFGKAIPGLRAKPKEPPHVVALRELEKIHQERLWQNDRVKLYYTKVTDVLRIYLEERFAIQATELTSDEILGELERLLLSEKIMQEERDFLSIADLVKFAKYIPAREENENAIQVVRHFVNTTKNEETPNT